MLRVRVALSGWAGGPGLSTFYFLTPLEDAAAAARIVARVHTFYEANNAKGLFYDPVRIQVSGDVDVLTAASGLITNTLTVAPPAIVNGFGGGQATSPAIAGNFRLNTSTFLAGRRLRGRIFISPLPTSGVETDGTATEAMKSTANGAGTALIAGDPGDLWVVWHRPKLGVGGTAGPITSVSMADKLAVLTSRRD